MAKIMIYVPEVVYTPYVFEDEDGVRTPQAAVKAYREGLGTSEPSWKWYEGDDLEPQEYPWKIEVMATEKRDRRVIDFDGHDYKPATTYGGCTIQPKPKRKRKEVQQ